MIEGRVKELKCAYTGRTTALCICNKEPDSTHEDACLTVLRNTEDCGRVQYGEALCTVDPE